MQHGRVQVQSRKTFDATRKEVWKKTHYFIEMVKDCHQPLVQYLSPDTYSGGVVALQHGPKNSFGFSHERHQVAMALHQVTQPATRLVLPSPDVYKLQG